MPSRRTARDWARSAERARPVVDVLLPTSGRVAELAVVLAGLAAQDDPPFRIIVSDQSDDHAMADTPAVQAMLRVLRAQGRDVRVLQHLPRRGIAEHRAFLLEQATAEYVLFLDDDVWPEPGLLATLHRAIEELGCGLVGSAQQGLSYLEDVRPHEQAPFTAWSEGVRPERLRKDSPGTERWTLHNAANLTHIAARTELPEEGWLPYRVAWLAGCVLYRRSALEEVGGFDFWRDLPATIGGEDVAAQWKVMERFGGAGVLPSGAVHLEAPTSIPDRSVDAAAAVFAHETAG
ncbi:glycosyltransferase family 2 protein [Amnibacterium kyonggiense]|uniref:Glycosyl transferase family 2 n=1 Tax=Amnibacterium kyonggiense TaxID=595671 RepID=A0A4R7FJ63_9MICO|nr:glycosyltransferase family A protein [Amnibacterium kyonggiense]TDS76052.1 glycosyl transferase family 2 [Amnibacterium kyonggiense]